MASRFSSLAALTVAKSLRTGLAAQGSTRLVIRPLASSSSSGVNQNIFHKQQLYGENDDNPVYLKGGLIDSLLSKFTYGCCVVGTLIILKTYFSMLTK